MSTGLVRRARALRLYRNLLINEERNKQLEELTAALEAQTTRIESLMRYELQLKLNEQPSSNVVPLKTKRSPVRIGTFGSIKDRRYAVHSPCLLEGQNEEERRKVALEIHSRTNRVAFLNYADLTLTGEEDFDQLSDCSLYICELAELPKIDQVLISRALEKDSHPLFISSTNTSLMSLKKNTELDQALVEALSVAHFRLQHPLRYYLEHGFFKLFLESLG